MVAKALPTNVEALHAPLPNGCVEAWARAQIESDARWSFIVCHCTHSRRYHKASTFALALLFALTFALALVRLSLLPPLLLELLVFSSRRSVGVAEDRLCGCYHWTSTWAMAGGGM